MSKPLLLLFVRQPVLGKVKTRLAHTMGPEKALQVYQQLLQHTFNVCLELEADKWVCYADVIPKDPDLWSNGAFIKHQQPQSPDLGVRMQEMVAQGLLTGHSPIVIIGSDCPGLTLEIVKDAFQQLQHKQVVLGPAQDGGYYLLGLQFLVPELFLNIPWSTSTVFSATQKAVSEQGLSLGVLPTLSDIDVEQDLTAWPAFKP